MLCVAITAAATLLAQGAPPNYPFTYQGKLERNGKPYNGDADFKATLYADLQGNTALKSSISYIVPVVNGVFTLRVFDFVPSDFQAAERYIGIDVRTNRLDNYTALLPIQRVTWAPTAMIAMDLYENLPGNRISGPIDPSLLGSGSLTGSINFDPQSGPPFSVNTSTKVANLNADLLDGLDSGNFVQKASAETITGTKVFAPPSGAPFLVNTSTKVDYLNADLLDGLDSSAFLQKSGGTMSGTLGIANGTTLNFGNQTRQMINLYNAGYGIGVQHNTFYNRTENSFAWYKDGSHNDLAGSPGSGGSKLMTLNSQGSLSVSGAEAGYYMSNRDNAGQTWTVYSRNYDGEGTLGFWNSVIGTDAARLTTTGNLYVRGEISATVLTVRGGADLAEPFEMTNPEEMGPGTVVVIDAANPGRLTLSTAAYDTCVAGIISGAGGVQPGLRLQQDGVMEGDHHVALSGRVYVKADATDAPIRAGDLLTTATRAGYAMRAVDRDRAAGAVIGKAMTALDEGTGLVLVLVSLQ